MNVGRVSVQGRQQERSKASFQALGLPNEMATQDNLMKKALGQVLCLLVAMAFAS
jgi:hypothetical protein